MCSDSILRYLVNAWCPDFVEDLVFYSAVRLELAEALNILGSGAIAERLSSHGGFVH